MLLTNIENNKMRICDVPIMNIFLKSKVLAGTKVKETFKDNKSREITLTSTSKLHKKTFEFYAKAIKVVNTQNKRALVIDSVELCGMFNIKANHSRELSTVDDVLKPLMEVVVTYEDDKSVKCFHLIDNFEYFKNSKKVSIEFNQHFVDATKVLWNRFFDIDFYSRIKNPKTRALLQYIESKYSSKNPIPRFRRSELCDLVGYDLEKINNIECDKKRDNAVFNMNKALKKHLDELLCGIGSKGSRYGYIEKYNLNRIGSFKNDPLYTITVVPKDERTIERDAEMRIKQENHENIKDKKTDKISEKVNELKSQKLRDFTKEAEQMDDIDFN